MAQLLIRALKETGAQVDVASRLRTHSKDPSRQRREHLQRASTNEVTRLLSDWTDRGTDKDSKPDLWFTYHPYYKSPDWIGPAVCDALAIPYVTAEASFSPRRQASEWAEWQTEAVTAITKAAQNFCLTKRDQHGLLELSRSLDKPIPTTMLPPFLDDEPFRRLQSIAKPNGTQIRLITVAMMREGDKLESYRMLARALQHLPDTDLRLAIIGDGPARAAVEHAFQVDRQNHRVDFHGECHPRDIVHHLIQSDIYVWPGFGEAFGLAVLEAQAAGLPVIAQEIAGLPAVVRHGTTGILTPPHDDEAFAIAIQSLSRNSEHRANLGRNARAKFIANHTISGAAQTLRTALHPIVQNPRAT